MKMDRECTVEKINIVMSTDENYVIPTLVTLSSILTSSKKGTCFHVYILCDRNFNYACRDMLKKLEKKDDRIEFTFKEIHDSRLDKAVATAHISVASYYRLYISQMIEEERCLFIDGDMIIRDDLSEVYNTDMENDYVAAVKDLGVQSHMSEYKEYADILHIPSMDDYVNVGFMLLNLNKIREDHVEHRMIEAIGSGCKYMDQDIINKCCYGKIKILSLKYDFFTEYYGSIAEKPPDGYSEEELSHIEERACVLHFTGYFKPWICTRLKVNTLWWNEAGRVLDESVYRNIWEAALEAERKSDWSYIRGMAEKAEQVVVFGFSEIGKKVADHLLRSNVKSIAAFADNDKAKQGMTYRGIPVISAARLEDEYPNAFYIISSQNGFIPIKKQLNQMEINDCRIIRYIHKDNTYYARLDEKYMEYEKKMQG